MRLFTLRRVASRAKGRIIRHLTVPVGVGGCRARRGAGCATWGPRTCSLPQDGCAGTERGYICTMQTGFSRQSDRQLFVWDVRGTDKGKAVVEHL
eukprot:3216959-Rhodomonas_salina.1